MARNKSLFVFACLALSFGFAQTASADFGSFLPGTVQDPADPPTSSGGWPYSSKVITIFSEQSLGNAASPLNILINPGDPIPSPQVSVTCDDMDKPDEINCRCDGNPIDLRLEGEVVAFIQEDDPPLNDLGVRPNSLACATISIGLVDVISSGSLDTQDCKYESFAGTTKGQDKVTPEMRIAADSEITIHATCAGMDIFPDENSDLLPSSDAYAPCTDFPCTLPIGLQAFGNDKELAENLPADGKFGVGQIALLEQSGDVLTRTCPGTPETGAPLGGDRSTIRCSDGKGKKAKPNLGEQASFEGFGCSTDWKPGTSGVIKVLDNTSNSAPLEIKGNSARGCDAAGILAAAEQSSTPDVTIRIEGVEDEGCHLEGSGRNEPDLQCQFFEDELYLALECASKPDQVVNVVASAEVLVDDVVKQVTASGAVQCGSSF